MGILSKIFGKKGEKQVGSTDSKQIEVATLSYGYHTIPVEAFREGLKKGATIKAFCDKTGGFIPLSQLGDTLLLSDPLTNTVSPLINYKGEEYKDIYNYVFGSGYNRYEEKYNDSKEDEEDEDEGDGDGGDDD